MKKLFASFIITFFLFSFSYAKEKDSPFQNRNFSFSAKPFLGLEFGNYGEYVYSWSDRYIRSYLQWNIAPLAIGGVSFGIGYKDFETHISASAGLPVKCGKMYDSDWNGYGIKTTYSIHENHAQQNFGFDILFKYNFKIGRFTLAPLLQAEYDYNYFQSQNGRGWYGSSEYNTSDTGEDVSWDSQYAKRYRVSRISLKRTDFYTFFGLDFGVEIFSRLFVSLSTYFSPYTYCSYSDYHHDDSGKGRDFYLNSSQICFFQRFKEKLSLQLKLTKSWSLQFDTEWIFGSVIRGMLEDYDQKGGSDINVVKMTFGARVEF